MEQFNVCACWELGERVCKVAFGKGRGVLVVQSTKLNYTM